MFRSKRQIAGTHREMTLRGAERSSERRAEVQHALRARIAGEAASRGDWQVGAIQCQRQRLAPYRAVAGDPTRAVIKREAREGEVAAMLCEHQRLFEKEAVGAIRSDEPVEAKIDPAGCEAAVTGNSECQRLPLRVSLEGEVTGPRRVERQACGRKFVGADSR